MNQRGTKQLIDAALEGEISEADFLLLEAELTVDNELRKEYLRRVTLSTLLEAEATSQDSELDHSSAMSIVSLSSYGWRGLFTGGGMLLATTVLVLFASHYFTTRPAGNERITGNVAQPASDDSAIANRREQADSEQQAAGYGVISGQHNALWADAGVRTTGSLLPTGEIELRSGVVHIELFSGVSVVMEGPAEFVVDSPMHLHLRSGKLRAHVPEPAHGFRVSTRDGEVVDLGTDFAVDVTDSRSELHVVEGEVLLRKGTSTQRLETGQAIRMSENRLTDLPADANRFVGQSEIVGRLQMMMKSRRERWLAWNERRRDDTRLLALYQPGFGQRNQQDSPNKWRSNRRIPNVAQSASGGSEGTIVAAVRTTDRWQHRDGALDFSPTGSRVRLTIPGQHRSLTLSCWVKINSLDRWYNSLFLTDGHDQHEPHWQIMDNGRLFFSVKKRDNWDAGKGEKDKHVYYSPPFWDSSMSGQWLMIATVYDVDKLRVTHFLNGREISREAIPDEYLVEQVKIGNASLCNWSLPERDEPRFAVRNLNGSLDEFAIYSAALSPNEIQEIYTHGKP